MASALSNERIIGGIGVVAVIIFAIAMLAAIVIVGDFGNHSLRELFDTEGELQAGAVAAGVLLLIFGVMIFFCKSEPKIFIGRVRSILIILSGLALVVLGIVSLNDAPADWAVYLFIVLISLAAVSDVFYNWITGQKALMVFSVILMLLIVLTGVLSQVNSDNYILGFAFAIFVMLWILLIAAIRFAPVEESKKGSKKPADDRCSDPSKKNVPAPKPYPAKKEETKPAPKKEEPKPAPKPEPKKEEPKPAPKKEEPKDEVPKVKVMSSAAAAAAAAARKKEPEPEPEPAPEPADDSEGEEFDELDLADDTPDALLRRATWNKGLRCRRFYGEHQIPIAFVKAKVAVFVQPEPCMEDNLVDEKIRADGWKVFRYLEKDITDGKEQAEEINLAVKENLKAERAAKKKKKK